MIVDSEIMFVATSDELVRLISCIPRESDEHHFWYIQRIR